MLSFGRWSSPSLMNSNRWHIKLNPLFVYKSVNYIDNISLQYIYYGVYNLFYLCQVSRAMELKGHTAGVYHFSFSADSTRYWVLL